MARTDSLAPALDADALVAWQEHPFARQDQLFQSILENMGEAVVVIGADGEVLLSNPAARRILPADLRAAFSDGDDQPPLPVQPIARCLQGESFDHIELCLVGTRHDPARWVSLTGRPLRDEAGTPRAAILVGRDITTRRRNERRRQMQYAVTRSLAEEATLQEGACRILRYLAEGLGADVGVLWTIHPRQNALECSDVWNRTKLDIADFLAETVQALLPLGKDLPGLVWLRGRPICEPLENIATARIAHARKVGFNGACAFPLQRGSRTVGVIEFLALDPLAPDDDFQTLVLALGGQIAQVLDRQRMEKALRDSEALFESLVQSLPQNIFRKDREGRFVFANQRFCETVGHPLNELLGKTDFELFPAEMAAKYVADDRRILQTGEPLDTVEEHRLPDGRRLFVQVAKTLVADAQGNVVGVQGIFWDVTAKWLAEERVAQSERRYRQLTEATLDAIVLTDEKDRILLFNPAAERMFGYRSQEVVGTAASFLASDELRSARAEVMQRFLKSREAHAIGSTREMVARHKDGSEIAVEVALSVFSLADTARGADRAGPVHFLAAIRDVTERTKMRATLVRNEKMASIGLLSAGMAHEINNPLSFVSNNLVVLQRDCLALFELVDELDKNRDRLHKADPELAQAWQEKADDIDLDYLREHLGRLLTRTRDGVDRVTRIIHSLRGMARTDSPRRQETDLTDIINSSLEILHGKYKRFGIEVVQEHDGIPRVPCVSTQISQVVLNLLVNAFQAVECYRIEGGKIWVRTRRSQGCLVLEVADNGVGIPPENHARIFDPFFTTKEVGEGTGLGLSISHHIIAGHDGRVEVESSPGAGACFRIYLPLE